MGGVVVVVWRACGPRLPDALASQRLDALHIALRLVLGRNYDGPVAEVLAAGGGNKVAVDLCNGTGLW